VGQGRYGIVKRGRKTGITKKKYAIKQIAKETIAEDMQLLEQELNILTMVDHPNIVKFYEIYKDESTYHIVTEYCAGGELY